MKKIISVFCLLLVTTISYSQRPDCNCGPATYKESFKNLCSYTYHYIPRSDNPDLFVEFGLWVKFKWEERICRGRLYINILSVEIGTPILNHKQLENNGVIAFVGGDPLDPLTGCLGLEGYPGDLTNNDKGRRFLDMMISKYGPQGNTGNPEILIEGGCTDLVRIVWPPEAGFWVPAGDNPTGGPLPANRWVPLSDTWELVKCTGATCCKFINNPNGSSSSTPVPGEICENAEIDPNWTPRIGNFTGEVVGSTGCKPSCGSAASYGSFTTSISKDHNAIELTSYPTLVSNLIYFNSKLTIKNANVYDSKGKKVLHKELSAAELDLSSLKPGIYYIQLEFDTKDIRTIKVVKE